eukprot:scaffold14104_cov200-Alexandrium_tamarense.AAC.4
MNRRMHSIDRENILPLSISFHFCSKCIVQENRWCRVPVDISMYDEYHANEPYCYWSTRRVDACTEEAPYHTERWEAIVSTPFHCQRMNRRKYNRIVLQIHQQFI